MNTVLKCLNKVANSKTNYVKNKTFITKIQYENFRQNFNAGFYQKILLLVVLEKIILKIFEKFGIWKISTVYCPLLSYIVHSWKSDIVLIVTMRTRHPCDNEDTASNVSIPVFNH